MHVELSIHSPVFGQCLIKDFGQNQHNRSVVNTTSSLLVSKAFHVVTDFLFFFALKRITMFEQAIDRDLNQFLLHQGQSRPTG